MPQLLESTRNYLKSSTKLGRRLSNRDESASEGSVHSFTPSNVETLKSQQPQQQHHRSTSSLRLSSLFAFEGKNRSSVSTEERAAVSRKSESETHDSTQQVNKKKRRSSSSQKSTQSLPTGSLSDKAPASDKSRRTATVTSMYDVRPDDYPSIDQYQAHVWRRNLLEESIMHSLKLGYAEKPRTAKRSATDRTRKSIAAGNSPYQMANSSSANITHSFITLELPEDQVAQVLSASAVPHLFQIKHTGRDSNASRILHSTGPSPSPRVLSGKSASRHMVHKETILETRHMPPAVAAAV